MPEQTLILLANEVRNKTLKLLEGVGDDEARFAAPNLHNTILWHAGHVLTVVEHLAVMPITGAAASYPDDYFARFSWKSNPAAISDWPALAEIVERLREQLSTVTGALASLAEDRLDEVVDPARNRTLRYSILHGFHDEANHQGEIWLLRKMRSKRTAGAGATI